MKNQNQGDPFASHQNDQIFISTASGKQMRRNPQW
jgi:hypothetical protein